MKIEKLNQSYSVMADNGKSVGSFKMDVDGYYYLWFDKELTGCFTAQNLKDLSNKLFEVNYNFDRQVAKDFAENKWKK